MDTVQCDKGLSLLNRKGNRILLPSQGRLLALAKDCFSELCPNFKWFHRRLQYVTKGLEILLARSEDIPWLVAKGFAGLGITGRDYVYEAGCDAKVQFVRNIGICEGQLCLIGPKNGPAPTLVGLPPDATIISQYPSFARRSFAAAGRTDVRVLEISGAAEGFLAVGAAIAAVDVVSSGLTAKTNEVVVGQVLGRTSAVLIQSRGVIVSSGILDNILRAVDAVGPACR